MSVTAITFVSPPLTITLFGPMQVRIHARPLPHLRSRKVLWLLALLTLRQGRPVEREWLAGTLWPDADQSRASTYLSVISSELRRALGDQRERLRSPSRRTLSLDLAGAEVDIATFDAAMISKKPEALKQAVALYRGPLLEDCAEEWVAQERRIYEQNCLDALQILKDAALATGDDAAAIGYYQRAASLDPWSDTTRRGWMEALAKSGNRNAALQVYREYVELLRGDPSAMPHEETSALYHRLRAEARQQSRVQAVVAPEAVPDNAVPSRRVSGYLPHPLTDLIGREDERLEVAARLRTSRLVTLTGLGGIGKTRLAIEVASEILQDGVAYPDGVWLVPLESLSEGRLVVAQVASLLGLREEPGRSLQESLTDHLRTRRLLLVLDNCEHLLEACAQVAHHLLRECAEVRILTTSREALGITGEAAWTVPALAVPSPEHLPKGQATLLRVLMGFESVQLFVERAQAIQKGFALTRVNALAVAQICSQLEGIPLAIELAAARVKAMVVEQIAQRLDDHLSLLTGGSRTVLSRQQTLRATMDWSYALLSEPEQIVLRRLSVFAGGWTLEAGEAVCAGGEITANDILPRLTTLVDKSLVAFVGQEQAGGGRYRLSEVVRQYAAGKLQEGEGSREAETKHRDWFVALAEAAESELKGAEQQVWIRRLVSEYDNLRIAMSRCGKDASGVEAGLRLTGALWRFWAIQGTVIEGHRHLQEALARDRTRVPTQQRAKALHGSGAMLFRQGEYASSRECHEQALRIYEQIGDRSGIGDSLFHLGVVAGTLGDLDSWRTLSEQSMVIFRELGDRNGIAMILSNFGMDAMKKADFARAKSIYEESLELFRALGNRSQVAWSLNHLGAIASIHLDYALAERYLEESLALFEELGERHGQAVALSTFAGVDPEGATMFSAVRSFWLPKDPHISHASFKRTVAA